MTEQEVGQFFFRLRGKRRYRESLEREQENAMLDLCRIKAVNYEDPRVSGGSSSDISKRLIAAEEKNRIRAKRIAQLIEEIEEASAVALDMIDTCDTYTQKSVLIDRWLSDMRWEEIEERQNYSERHLKRIEEAGIAAIARNYREDVRECPTMSDFHVL